MTLSSMHNLSDLVTLPYLGLYTHLDHVFWSPFPRSVSYPSVGFPSLVFLVILTISSPSLLLLYALPLTFLKHGSLGSSSCLLSHTTSSGELYFLGCVFHSVLLYPKVSHSLWFVDFTFLFSRYFKEVALFSISLFSWCLFHLYEEKCNNIYLGIFTLETFQICFHLVYKIFP